MKLQELFEAQNYDEMFGFLDTLIADEMKRKEGKDRPELTPILSVKARCSAETQWAKNHLRRKDRITWYLRYVKIWAIDMLQGNLKLDLSDASLVKLDAQLTAVRSKVAPMSNAQFQDIVKTGGVASLEYKAWFEHMLSLPVPAIQNYQFTNQASSTIEGALLWFEDEWKKESEGTAETEGKIFLQIDDKMAWYDLETPYSEQEACAMGHCGNKPARNDENQTILSLREKLPNGRMKVDLTFIFHQEEGMLGEMKGRGNEKPADHYHEAIVKLIMDPRIEGIVSGGYAHERNFSIFDLGEEEAKKLLNEKPRLCPTGEYIAHFGVDAKIKTELANIFQLPDDTAKLEGQHVKVVVAKDIETLAADFKGEQESEWLFKYTVGSEHPEVDTSELSPRDIESNMSQEVTEKFIASAKKMLPKNLKMTDDEDTDLNYDDVETILDWLKENDEDAWHVIQQCNWNAQEAGILDAMHEYMKEELNDDYDGGVTVDVVIDATGTRDNVELENIRASLEWDSVHDGPIYAKIPVADVLTETSGQYPFFTEIIGVEFRPYLKFEEPRNGFSATYDSIDAFEKQFNENLQERMDEIFGSFSPRKKA